VIGVDQEREIARAYDPADEIGELGERDQDQVRGCDRARGSDRTG